ncbi:ligase-associated DNA damage response exonuclease [Legionella hackeliae]|uniref:Exonuclease of the beta-lactamase fold involved in RNA processing-like protein n=1 Tax=Legionella hackeliae TaxID=449 RepID=A0A0A8UUS3_LEGHA|nr:ligase-associated DNA damage response exonuclease [Legionella hackeliae]KTD13833.1 Metallo-beta-lactamase superfamily protein [Legionella hackeliae]CEK10534.1 Exonuclease of the beta-lactamase fold involved in RNA processing-like protein [Legionella hackeliae]STX47272.1 F0F1-type ATP synthase, epsilon subunit (mitochondrial delta subunit) [Legionella hackeliae]
MVTTTKWLTLTPQGLYCIPGQFYIDPTSLVSSAIITHGHSDHALAGHHKILATPETVAIMQLRYGIDSTTHWQSLSYFQSLLINQVKVLFLPAGHVLGSAQIVLEYDHNRVIISGDYKRRFDPTCMPFEALNCDTFITEATFGLPVFKHPPIEHELNKLLHSLETFSTCHLVGVYPLGKCQRLIKSLRIINYQEPIYLHGALIKLCQLYETFGVKLGELRLANTLDTKSAAGKIVLCPPSSLNDRWTRRFGESIKAQASGWMQIRARAKQKAIDLPLIISDHADWPELVQTMTEVNPYEIWVTHGQEEALVYYATKNGYQAQALHLMGYEEDGN